MADYAIGKSTEMVSRMNLSRFDAALEEYLQHICLTKQQASLIDHCLTDSFSFLQGSFPDADIYAQGSYALGTVVKPLTERQSKSGIAGEFDVDIVTERAVWMGATSSLESLRVVLLDEYGGLVDAKRRIRCERVNFGSYDDTGVSFHADYVPIKDVNLERYAPHRAKDIWEPSDTKALVEWFRCTISEGEMRFLPAIVLFLKRIRDYAGLTDALSSICILALAYDGYADTGSYAGDLLDALTRICERSRTPREELNITMPTQLDNLAAKITESDYCRIRTSFQQALNVLSEEFKASVPTVSKIRQYLSDDFPADLEEFPNCLESLRSRGFSINLDGDLERASIKEALNLNQQRTKYRSCFFGRGQQLRFDADEKYRRLGYSIRWQVLNSSTSVERRGELFEARKKNGYQTNSNKFVNFETISYSGAHWVRYYVYDPATKQVIAISDKYYVDVNGA